MTSPQSRKICDGGDLYKDPGNTFVQSAAAAAAAASLLFKSKLLQAFSLKEDSVQVVLSMLYLCKRDMPFAVLFLPK